MCAESDLDEADAESVLGGPKTQLSLMVLRQASKGVFQSWTGWLLFVLVLWTGPRFESQRLYPDLSRSYPRLSLGHVCALIMDEGSGLVRLKS